MGLMLAIAVMALAPVSDDHVAFDCQMFGPDAANFNLRGTSDGIAFRTNLSAWLGLSAASKFSGGRTISMEGVVHSYEWNGPKDRVTLNVKMIEYSNQNAAVLTVVEHFSDGRHALDKVIGTGLCKTRRGSKLSKGAK